MPLQLQACTFQNSRDRWPACSPRTPNTANVTHRIFDGHLDCEDCVVAADIASLDNAHRHAGRSGATESSYTLICIVPMFVLYNTQVLAGHD